jgi:hypothetical protein
MYRLLATPFILYGLLKLYYVIFHRADNKPIHLEMDTPPPTRQTMAKGALIVAVGGKKNGYTGESSLKMPEATVLLREIPAGPSFDAYTKLLAKYGAGNQLYGFVHFIPAAGALVTHDSFPIAPLGLIHIRQEVEWKAGSAFSASSKCSGKLEMKGAARTVKGLEVSVAQTVPNKMNGVITFLSRGGGLRNKGESGEQEDDIQYEEERREHLPATLGVDYATISGDWNPFHVSKLGAKLLGFRGMIAHGMFTAALGLKPDTSPRSMTFSFKRPCVLPADVSILRDSTGEHFKVVSARNGEPYVVGSIRY